MEESVMRNPYFILGVQPDAGKDEIKSAFRRLAMAFHPDQNPGDFGAQERFSEINAAYQILGNPDRRREFDEGLIDARGRKRPGSAAGKRTADPFAAADINRRRPEPQERPEDVAERIFGEAFQQAKPAADAARAAGRATINDAPGIDDVPVDGAPAEPRTEKANPAKPQRSWSLFDRALKPLFGLITPRDETGASDTHVRLEVPLATIMNGGEHEVRRSDGSTVSVKVPRGALQGDIVRVSGQGSGADAGSRGDLCVAIVYEKDARFRSEGRDLVVAVPLTLDQAVFGATLTVESLDGPMPIKVDPWSDSAASIRVARRGLPTSGGARGDLVCELRLMLPAETDEKLTDLLRMQRGAWFV
jgi:DnaJ-class molecular chaperone